MRAMCGFGLANGWECEREAGSALLASYEAALKTREGVEGGEWIES
jgi:hypothetical protein